MSVGPVISQREAYPGFLTSRGEIGWPSVNIVYDLQMKE